MKFPRGSVILLTLLMIVTLSLEQAFALPVLTVMILLVQQPLLSDLESCVLAGVVGFLFAVVYHFPLAVGIGVLLLATALSRTVLQRTHVQARDAVVTLAICGSLAWVMKLPLTPVVVGEFLVYFLFVIFLIRLWISRRSFHAKHTKPSS